MTVSYRHESVRLTGRWDVSNDACAETTNPGAYLEFAFEGKMAVARFDVETNTSPILHLWVVLDDNDMIEVPIDSYIRIIAKNHTKHVCRIIFKSSEENERRWYRPLHSKVSFIGFQAEKPVAIEPDNRKTIEFVGDSITEGVLIDVDFCEGTEPRYYHDDHNRPYQDDSCATYAWLTAEKLNMRPIIMGYGSLGATRMGNGKVPASPISYSYNFDGSPITHRSDYVVINHGANDRKASTEEYLVAYGKLLDTVISHQPQAKIISLSAFCGARHEELGDFIEKYNSEKGTDVYFIDSFDWVPVEPLHPLRGGHAVIAEHLYEEIKKIIK